LRQVLRVPRRTHDDEIERGTVEKLCQHFFRSSRPGVFKNALLASTGRNIDHSPSFLRHQFQHRSQG